MSNVDLGRVKADLAVIQRAMGLQLSFGKGMLAFGLVLSLAAVCSAGISLLSDNEWVQLGPFAAIMVLPLLGLYIQSRRAADLSHEIKLQVVLSITIYCAVWIAACGYAMATILGPTIGTVRTAGLYACSILYVFAFSLILVLNALKSRERYYCLGLAVSLLLAGLLLPIVDRQYSFPLAHCFLAIGLLTGVVIQWVQLRKAVPHHAAD